MMLKDLFSLNIKFTDVEYDSREIKKGNLFFAIVGLQDDGNLFIEEAINNGAIGLVVSEDFITKAQSGENKTYSKILKRILHEKIAYAVVQDVVLAVSNISAEFYNYPSRSMNVVGITGTNGKTSFTFILESLLNKAKIKTGIVSTILYRYPGKNIDKIEYTTPKSLFLQRIMRDMIGNNIDNFIFEVSSHSIELGRVSDIDFDVAVYSNLTQDHLDFHVDMENYFNAKRKFFNKLLARSTKKEKLAIINIDCPYGKRLYDEVKQLRNIKIVSYGIDNDADYKVDDLLLMASASNFSMLNQGNKYKFKIPLVGKHNVYNTVSALIVAFEFYNLNVDFLIEAVSDLVIPGRLEKISNDHNIFVDYAHTSDALENVLNSLRYLFPNKKIITVFGCGGDRDKTKRPKMAKVASQLSDYTIVTSDNPRFEEPKDIINDILPGLETGSNYKVIVDRREAIKHAMETYNPETNIVLIAGKGHETYQDAKGIKTDFDDRIIAKAFISLIS